MKLTKIQAEHKKKILALFRKNDIVLLGGSTGYGKTVVSWSLIEEWVRQKKRILVLTHGRKEIRENFSASKAAKIDFLVIKKSTDLQGSEKFSVVVSLPQTIYAKLDLLKGKANKFDMLIIDEAHQYYNEHMVNKIVDKISPKKQLLLTATHFNFICPKVLCSRQQLFEDKKIPDISLNLVPTRFTLDLVADYSESGKLKNEKRLPKKLIDCIKKLIKPKNKSLIITHNIDAADRLYKSLKPTMKDKVAVSHSESDKDLKILKQFGSGEFDVLIVVDRAQIGFDYPNLNQVLDLTFMRNIERIDQIFGRLCRQPKDCDVEKEYLKLTPLDHIEEFKVIMAGVLALSVTEIYEAWDGQKSKLKIPDFDPIFQDSHDRPLENVNFRIDKKYIESFSSFISCFNDKKLISLSKALERIKKSSNWLTYEDCKQIASKYSRLAEWRLKHRISYNHADKKGWLPDICKDLRWQIETWLFKEVLNEVRKCQSLEDWNVIYPDSFEFASQKGWVPLVIAQMGWVVNQ